MKQQTLFTVVFLLVLLLSFSCNRSLPENKLKQVLKELPQKRFDNSNKMLERYGLVDVTKLDDRILVDLKYASEDNFLSRKIYKNLDKAYLQEEVAQMLARSQKYLDLLYPGMRLLVYDAVRPLDAQQKLWEMVKDTKYRRYVADPDRHSLHNYGAAVDLTIIDSTLKPLDMGTPFDYFGQKAGINNEDGLKAIGLLTDTQIDNRKLLRKVMIYSGFYPIHGEWWHFNACSLAKAKKQYKLVERL